jgi:hypothetical protein
MEKEEKQKKYYDERRECVDSEICPSLLIPVYQTEADWVPRGY